MEIIDKTNPLQDQINIKIYNPSDEIKEMEESIHLKKKNNPYLIQVKSEHMNPTNYLSPKSIKTDMQNKLMRKSQQLIQNFNNDELNENQQEQQLQSQGQNANQKTQSSVDQDGQSYRYLQNPIWFSLSSQINIQKIQEEKKRAHIFRQIYQQTRQKLRMIFSFYSSFGDRKNINFLKSNKFQKMMIDTEIEDSINFPKKQLDIFFVRYTQTKQMMTFDDFLEFLPKLASLKYPELDEIQAFVQLIENHFLPLYENILRETDLGIDLVIFDQEFDPKLIDIIYQVIPGLMQIYLVTFPLEPQSCLKKDQVKSESFKALNLFLTEYELCPQLMTKSTSYLLFDHIVNTPSKDLAKSEEISNILPFLEKDIGTVFTLSRFITYLIRSALIGFARIFKNDPHYNEKTQMENFLMLLK